MILIPGHKDDAVSGLFCFSAVMSSSIIVIRLATAKAGDYVCPFLAGTKITRWSPMSNPLEYSPSILRLITSRRVT